MLLKAGSILEIISLEIISFKNLFISYAHAGLRRQRHIK